MTEKEGILILGAGGFIGTNLANALVARGGACLRLFDRAFPADRSAMWGGTDCELITGDLMDPALAGPLTRGIDTVYHLVSTTCPSNSNVDIAAEFTDNVVPTVRLLDACVKNGVKRVVFLSSGGTVYGREGGEGGMHSEGDEAFPISSYGVQKLTIERLLYLYDYLHGLDYRIVRLANPYGPYQRPDGVQGVVTTFLWRTLTGGDIRVYGDGGVIRDYIYIDDAVRGILRIAGDGAPHRIYNLGRGEGASVREIIDAIERVTGIVPPVTYLPSRAVDVPVNVLDISRYEADFGPLTALTLDEGIRRTAAFFRAMTEDGRTDG